MAIDFLTGFEHGVASASGTGLADAITSSSVQSTVKRTGTYAFRCNAAGSSYFCRKSHSVRNYLALRVYIRCSARPASGTRGQVHSTLIGTATGNIEIDSNGVLYANFRDPTALQGSEATGPTLALDTWTRLDVLYDLHTSPNVINWQVDGSAQTDASFTNAARQCNNSNMGQVNTTATYSIYYDDWVQGTVAADFPFGAGKVVALVAGSDGTHSFTTNDFGIGDAGATQASSYTSFWLLVDDLPFATARSTTDAIGQRVIRSTGYVEITPATTSETNDANAVRALLAYSSSATQSNSGGCVVRNSAGTADVLFGDLPVAQGGNGGALADYSETTNFFKGVIVTSPGTWTPTEVNAIRWRLGGAGDISPVPTWQNLMLEADYPEVTASTYTKAGFGTENRVA